MLSNLIIMGSETRQLMIRRILVMNIDIEGTLLCVNWCTPPITLRAWTTLSPRITSRVIKSPKIASVRHSDWFSNACEAIIMPQCTSNSVL